MCPTTLCFHCVKFATATEIACFRLGMHPAKCLPVRKLHLRVFAHQSLCFAGSIPTAKTLHLVSTCRKSTCRLRKACLRNSHRLSQVRTVKRLFPRSRRSLPSRIRIVPDCRVLLV